MSSHKLTFSGARGDILTARFDLPGGGKPRAYALFAHCFTCSKDLKAARGISRTLASAGLGVLRFDFTGLGESEGDFADTNFSSNVDDLVAAAGYLAREHQPPTLLVGHSLGGAAVLMAAARLTEVKAVATIGAPAEPSHVVHLLQDSLEEIEAAGEACVLLAGREFTVKKQFLDDLEQTRMQRVIVSLRRPLLILHSPIDDTVGVANARDIFSTARHPKSFVSLDNADHLLSRPEDAEFAGSVIAGWVGRYLPPSAGGSRKGDGRDDRVVARTADTLCTEVRAGGFDLVADEPVEIGGLGSGPTPYDYLATALSACTSMTLRLYADRKGWPLEAVEVEVSHSKIHLKECRDRPVRRDRFERTVTLKGDLDDGQRNRLLMIADRCPVHHTLVGAADIETRLA